MLRSTLSRKRRIFLSTARGVAVGAVRRTEELRHHVVRDAWTVAKRFAAEWVKNIERREFLSSTASSRATSRTTRACYRRARAGTARAHVL